MNSPRYCTAPDESGFNAVKTIEPNSSGAACLLRPRGRLEGVSVRRAACPNAGHYRSRFRSQRPRPCDGMPAVHESNTNTRIDLVGRCAHRSAAVHYGEKGKLDSMATISGMANPHRASFVYSSTIRGRLVLSPCSSGRITVSSKPCFGDGPASSTGDSSPRGRALQTGTGSAQAQQSRDNDGGVGDWPSLDRQEDIRVNLADHAENTTYPCSLASKVPAAPGLWSP